MQILCIKNICHHFFQRKGAQEVSEWSPNSPRLNPIEILMAISKQQLRKQSSLGKFDRKKTTFCVAVLCEN